MKFNLIAKIGMLMLVCCCFTFSAFAQPKSVSKEDQQKIIDIFKEVPSSEYKLVFDDGKRTIGEKQIKMSDLKRVTKTSSPQAAGVKWTLVAGDRSANEVIYIYTEGMSKMASLLGKAKLKALQEIVAKYEDVSPN